MATSFYFYRMPGESKVMCGYSESTSTGFCDETGFVISPFDTSSRPVINIPVPPRECSDGDLSILDSEEISEGEWWPLSDASTSKAEHLDSVRNAIENISTDYPDGKIVVSRLLNERLAVSPSEAFLKLCLLYPDAYVFAFYTPQTGMWMGASPELLVRTAGKRLQTMSLAGTRKAGSDEPWDSKNLREQEIVTDYIRQVFSRFSLSCECSELFTRGAGPVEHLCKTFTVTVPEAFDIEAFCRELSPTPALSGYPKDYALRKIVELERHDRGCYGGYSGIVGGDECSLFVTVRAMHLDNASTNIFVGGGITADSNPEDEWNETEIKSATLLRSMKK